MKSLMCLIVVALALGCAALADDVTGAETCVLPVASRSGSTGSNALPRSRTN